MISGIENSGEGKNSTGCGKNLRGHELIVKALGLEKESREKSNRGSECEACEFPHWSLCQVNQIRPRTMTKAGRAPATMIFCCIESVIGNIGGNAKVQHLSQKKRAPNHDGYGIECGKDACCQILGRKHRAKIPMREAASPRAPAAPISHGASDRWQLPPERR